MDKTIIERLKSEIENFDLETTSEAVGEVLAVGDGIVEIAGLSNSQMGGMVVFDDADGKSLEEATKQKDQVVGVLLNLEENSVKAVVLGDVARVSEGMKVRSLGKVLSVGVGDGIKGRIVDGLGNPVDGKGSIEVAKDQPIEREAYGVIERAPVDTPIHTGIKSVDGMIPIGRGQRELIIGDRFTGKTTIAIDTIINQKNEPEATRPICIYVAIGQKESKTARIVGLLEEAGAMDYTIVVTAPASSPAALQFLAPFTGAAIGEFFMQQGKDALVVFDDLSKQAIAYRQLSLLLRRPPGREAYPGDIFYLHSRLLERSAKLSEKLGGGSLTALPVIETQEGDVSAYIPTNVISITDGQIFLEADLFNKGVRPAINVGVSVSRVGSAAQTKAMKKVAGKLKLELAQFRELEAFMQFSQDLDEGTKKRIEEGQLFVEMLKQNKHMPLAFQKQVPVMYAAINGHLTGVPVEKVKSLETKLIEYIETQHAEVLSSIEKDKDINENTTKLLEATLKEFKKAHKEFWKE